MIKIFLTMFVKEDMRYKLNLLAGLHFELLEGSLTVYVSEALTWLLQYITTQINHSRNNYKNLNIKAITLPNIKSLPLHSHCKTQNNGNNKKKL